jgi:hypothetical protein
MNKEKKINLLVGFLLSLNNDALINNYDFDYKKEAKKYLKTEAIKNLKNKL